MEEFKNINKQIKKYERIYNKYLNEIEKLTGVRKKNHIRIYEMFYKLFHKK